jgi:hypothetical protein
MASAEVSAAETRTIGMTDTKGNQLEERPQRRKFSQAIRFWLPPLRNYEISAAEIVDVDTGRSFADEQSPPRIEIGDEVNDLETLLGDTDLGEWVWSDLRAMLAPSGYFCGAATMSATPQLKSQATIAG